MNKRVLLIEDEPNIVEALRFLLSREGIQVDIHSDGQTALDAIERRGPELVILDVMLPNKSGYDILKELRDQEATRDLPVLKLTARGQKHDRDLAAQYGASRFMTKPSSNADVLACVHDLLNG